MIGQLFVRLAILLAFLGVVAGGSRAQAQGIDCRYFKVNTDRVSAFEEPRSEGTPVASLEKNNIVCVAGDEEVSGRGWVFIPYQVEPENKHKSIQGWAIKDSFAPASQDEVAALSSSRGPATSPQIAAAPSPTAPPRGDEPPRAEEPAGSKEIVRYSQPIQSGGFPVQGRTLEQLVHGVPMFPPIAGLPDDVWKKPCSNCHQWNRQTLCQQAQIYAQDIKMTMRKQHPYGGPEKLAMRNWAQHGCQ
jgi:hypothetical protein